jgi:hypothetical protein
MCRSNRASHWPTAVGSPAVQQIMRRITDVHLVEDDTSDEILERIWACSSSAYGAGRNSTDQDVERRDVLELEQKVISQSA